MFAGHLLHNAFAFILLEIAGDSPVHDKDGVKGADHDVVRLKIAMNNALAVGMGNDLADTFKDSHEFSQILLDRFAFFFG